MTDRSEIENLKSRIGQEIYVSDWISVTQAEIDEFGRVTRDCDPIHMDPAYALTHGPFGRTVLYGFQILAMLSYLCRPLRFNGDSGERGYDLNYGFNRVRFITPIPVNTLFRNRVELQRIQQRHDGHHLLTTTNTIEVEGADRPAVVAEWIGLLSRENVTIGEEARTTIDRAKNAVSQRKFER